MPITATLPYSSSASSNISNSSNGSGDNSLPGRSYGSTNGK